MNKNKKILEFSPAFFDVIIGGNVPDPRYVQSANPSRPTQGWRDMAPRTVGERQELMNKCGRDCFLDPDWLGYPICSRENDCKPQCSGILAAKIRANQWKYPDIAERADRLWSKHC